MKRERVIVCGVDVKWSEAWWQFPSRYVPRTTVAKRLTHIFQRYPVRILTKDSLS